MEDDDASTPHPSLFDPSSSAMTTTSNPGSVIHSPLSHSHSAQFLVEQNTSRSNSRQRARNTTNRMDLLKQQIGLAFQHISSSINQSQYENLIALDALSEDPRAQYTNLRLFQTRLSKGELIGNKELQDARKALATLEGAVHDEQERLKIAIAEEFGRQEAQQKENMKPSEVRDKILEAKVISLKAQFAEQLKKQDIEWQRVLRHQEDRPAEILNQQKASAPNSITRTVQQQRSFWIGKIRNSKTQYQL